MLFADTVQKHSISRVFEHVPPIANPIFGAGGVTIWEEFIAAEFFQKHHTQQWLRRVFATNIRVFGQFQSLILGRFLRS